MSFLDKVARIRAELLGAPGDMPPPQVVAAALPLMGIVPEPSWVLPQMVDAIIVKMTGIEAAPTPAAPAPAAAAASKPRSNAAGKAPAAAPPAASRKHDRESDSAKPTASKEQKIPDMDGITKFMVPKKALKQVAKRQAEGEAVAYEEVLAAAGLEVRELPSEKEPPAPAPGRVYGCDHCNKTFDRPCALASHRMWAHPSAAREPSVSWRRPPFPGKLSVSLSISAGRVSVSLLINGKDRVAMQRQAEEAAALAAEATAEREAEQKRRANRRQQQRESEEAINHVEQRRGSDHRHQYTYAEKAQLLDVLDQINGNKHIRNKGEAFEADPRRRGCPYTTAVKWGKPAERRKIAVGAAQEHAKSLLRFDKASRKKGKYAAMETRLFELFRKRRARGGGPPIERGDPSARTTRHSDGLAFAVRSVLGQRARRPRAGSCTRPSTSCAASLPTTRQRSRRARDGCSASSGVRAS